MEEEDDSSAVLGALSLPAPTRRNLHPAPPPSDPEAWRAAAMCNLGAKGGRKPQIIQPLEAGDQEEIATPTLEGPDPFVEVMDELGQRDTNELMEELCGQMENLNLFITRRPTLSSSKQLLQLMGRVSKAETQWPEKRASLLTAAAQPELLDRLPSLLVEAAEGPELSLGRMAEDVVLLLTALSQLLPLSAARLRPLALGCLNVCKGCPAAIPQDQLEDLQQRFQALDSVLEQKDVQQKGQRFNKKYQEIQRMKFAEAPENFRDIEVLPGPDDVLSNKQPFLRPNIIDGPYLDVQHYLDTQFRLLREDFVRPLREGVQDVVKGSSSRRCESVSVRVYKHVRFLRFVREMDKNGRVQNEGVLLSLDPSGHNRRLQKTNWEHSKRFMHGALLCFSSDDFKTILFATVSSRDKKYLEKCQILVAFSREYQENIFDRKKSFTMIESEVFFEPYNHVLKCLKKLRVENFPMKNYLVDMQREDEPPTYLLLRSDQVWLEGVRGGKFHVKVPDKATWPTAQQLGLDESQFRALQTVLSQELALVQGPPGTGKTFMALKIAEILLKNKVALGRTTPILVVCLTNHALDQFLAGLLKFTEKLVRIGGQSKMEELDKFNLKNLTMQLGRPGREEYDLKDAMRNKADTLLGIEARIESIEGAFRKEGIVPDPQCGPRKNPSWLLGGLMSIVPGAAEMGFINFYGLEQLIDTKMSEKLDNISSDDKLEPYTKKQRTKHAMYERYYLQGELRNLVTCINLHQPLGDDLPPSAEDIPQLDLHERIQVYFSALEKEKARLDIERSNIVMQISSYQTRLENLKMGRQIEFLREQDIIGLTTTGAARLHSMLQAIGPEIVIVEEAAEVMESHIVACLSNKCQHLILIGDHKQLRPTINVYELCKFYNFDVSLFERLVMNREGCVTLEVQHRMCPEMAKLIVPSVYKHLENHDSVLGRPSIKSLVKRLFFKTHNEPEQQDTENSSRTNEFEADFLLVLCQHLLTQGYDPSQITILATYRGQMFLIKKKIKSGNNNRLKEVHVTVVDNFQGEENEIVLLSLVRSNPEGKIGFLGTENRVCVALSRARSGFVIVGNMDILAATNPLWQAVKKELVAQDAFGTALPLKCEVHPEMTFKVTDPGDFKRLAPFGGCSKKCDFILDCGHDCGSVCHLMMKDHSQMKCQKPCQRVCAAKLHPCKQPCYIDCMATCAVSVTKTLPCQHEAQARCSADPATIFCHVQVEKVFELCGHSATVACSVQKCPKPCDNQVTCGHSCTQFCHMDQDPDHMKYICRKACENLNKGCSQDHKCKKLCFEDCELCKIEVKKKRSCGHSFKMLCHEDPEKIVCKDKCRKSLPGCGHFCKRKCFEECAPCQEPMEKVVPGCGHSVMVTCGHVPVRGDCDKKCEKTLSCGHKCTAKCCDPCTPKCLIVVEKALGSCGHQINRTCFEVESKLPVDVNKCSATCEETLACGHTCTGSCLKCHQGKFHVPCEKKTTHEMICGHPSQSKCSAMQHTCTRVGKINCSHGSSQLRCGLALAPRCNKPCSNRCKHGGCTRPCELLCNRDACIEPCSEILKCNHQCIGFCGDRCPELCWECDRAELEKNCMPSNSSIEGNAPPRFVLLLDCQHTVEVSALKEWFLWQSANVEAKSCPRCHTKVSLKLPRFKKEVLEFYQKDWQRIGEKIQTISRADQQHTTDLALQQAHVQVPDGSSLKKYIVELLTVSKLVVLGHTLKKVGDTDDMQVQERKIAIVTHLATSGVGGVAPRRLFVPSLGLTRSAADPEKLEFVVERLREVKTITQQQLDDFGRLLKDLGCKDVDISAPMRNSRRCWRKCLKCQYLHFDPKKTTRLCQRSKCGAALEHLEQPRPFPAAPAPEQPDVQEQQEQIENWVPKKPVKKAVIPKATPAEDEPLPWGAAPGGRGGFGFRGRGLYGPRGRGRGGRRGRW